jgi:hypothetical protein
VLAGLTTSTKGSKATSTGKPAAKAKVKAKAKR